MSYMLMFLQMCFIIIGAIYLFLSLVPIRRLIIEVEDNDLKKKWKILSSLIVFFIIFYVIFALNLWMSREIVDSLSLVISLMFLCGGGFCYLVGKLALQTMKDVKNLAILQHESVTDVLMGIKNRRYFDQKICEEVALSKRYKLPLSIIMVDVDYFKNINDTYGHKVGDEVLKSIAVLILSVVRDTDIVARYGGEEVVIITPNSGKQEAELLAERLRRVIESTIVTTISSTQEVVQVTASMGVCSMSHAITDKDALIEEADAALYIAKNQGRNRVVCSRW